MTGMRISLALAAVAIGMQCGINDINDEMKLIESGLTVSLPFYGTKGALTKKMRSSKLESKEINQKQEEIEAKERIYNSNMDNSIFKAIQEGDRKRILLQDYTVSTKRQTQQKLKDAIKGSRTKRALFKKTSIWEDGVFYTFRTSAERVRRVFEMAAKIWTESTCVDFAENNATEDKVVVLRSKSCWSSVGRVGGVQYLSLDKHASVGSAVHEIGHVLGLLHTMSRYDRDNYIRIEWQNVNQEDIGEFAKMSENESDIYGTMYDYGSIMHYDECSGSADNQLTMIATDAHYQKTMGSEILSFLDISAVNMRYGCNERCNESTSAKCENEGFPHPRNCSICICPSGYGGDLCDRRPPGCGRYLEAKDEKQIVIRSLGFGSHLRDLFDFCYYMISAPRGTRIEVEAQLVSDDFEIPGCPMGGIEIKAQMDQKMTGYRYCSRKRPEQPIVSSHSHLPLILYNRYGVMKVRFTYSYVD